MPTDENDTLEDEDTLETRTKHQGPISSDNKYTVFYARQPHRTRGGPWVIGSPNARYGFPSRQEAEAEADHRRLREEHRSAVIERAASEPPGQRRWGFPPSAGWAPNQRNRYHAPLMPTVEDVSGTQYDHVDVMRLLDRADVQAFKYIVRLADRMMGRQTQAERAMGSSIVLNKSGFNKPDSARAEKIMAVATDPNSTGRERFEAQYDLAELLVKYSRRQLLDIMNQGADRTRRVIRTNPWGGWNWR